MPAFTYDLAGQTAHIEVADSLADAYRAQPQYTEVVTLTSTQGEPVTVPLDELKEAQEAQAEADEAYDRIHALTGAALDAAVKKAKIEHPSSLSADEKRAALLEVELAGPADVADADTDPTPKD